MSVCSSEITGGFLVDCLNLPIAGLETDVVLINYDDIDRSASTISNTNEVLMTNLQLKAGKVGYLLQGIKQSNGKNYELVVQDNMFSKFKHGINGKILNPSAVNKAQLQKLANAKIVAVVKQKWKGLNNVDAFEVLGYNVGLMLSEATNNSTEESNTIVFALASEDGFEEPKVPFTLLETDFATTNTAFENLFVQAP